MADQRAWLEMMNDMHRRARMAVAKYARIRDVSPRTMGFVACGGEGVHCKAFLDCRVFVCLFCFLCVVQTRGALRCRLTWIRTFPWKRYSRQLCGCAVLLCCATDLTRYCATWQLLGRLVVTQQELAFERHVARQLARRCRHLQRKAVATRFAQATSEVLHKQLAEAQQERVKQLARYVVAVSMHRFFCFLFVRAGQ